METVNAYILKRTDGALVNLRFEPVKTIRSAARFHDEDAYHQFMSGYYKPDNPEDYYLQPIKVTYEEVQHERVEKFVSEN